MPRDTSGFQLYYGPWVSYNFKINTLLNSVDNGKLKSPDSGIVTLEKEIGFLVGIPINYYAAVDIDGFVKLVDAVGGVDVNNKHAIDDPPFLILPTGPAHLDGDTAMRYVRSREHGGSDYLRVVAPAGGSQEPREPASPARQWSPICRHCSRSRATTSLPTSRSRRAATT